MVAPRQGAPGCGPGIDVAGVVVVDDGHVTSLSVTVRGLVGGRHIAWANAPHSMIGLLDERVMQNRRKGVSVADRLIVKGAREHNLRGVDLDLPRDALIVFTGLSGSGKSSLAFDTIFAEGQRRYVESLSAYARQFLGQMDKPDVDFIEGLSPGGVDRPEVDQPQPAVDRRHHHRGVRLPASALRPRRHPALPGLR